MAVSKKKTSKKINKRTRIKTSPKKRVQKKAKRKLTLRTKVLILIGIGIGTILMFIWMFKGIPSPKKLADKSFYSEASQIFDRNGNLLYKFYADQNRVFVDLDQISEPMKEATLAIEDVKFYKHFGFDLKGLLRGLYRTLVKKRLQGGSTITQQLVKNALLSPERTIQRKIREAFLTLLVEARYSKDEILEMYFNQTPYGGTMWGVEAAANSIFNKKAVDLDLAEASLIAGLPASPSRYSPFTNPDAAKARQKMVLTRMVEVGMISQDDMDKAFEEELNYYTERSEIKAPHFVFEVREKLVEDYGIEKVLKGGLRVTTSLDLSLQEYIEDVITEEIAGIEKYNVTNGAALVTQAETGQVLAMVGSKDYWAPDIDGKYNVTTALRQPGSSIKPIAYATGLELGTITLGSVFEDGPTCFGVPNQRNYCPTNYGYNYFGIQSTRNSLGNSLNIPAVKVAKVTGVEAIVATATAMGISTYTDPQNYGLSIALGGGEVKMVDMNVAFGTFANSGIRQDLNMILRVEDNNGNEIYKYEWIPGDRAISRETAYLIQSVLSDDGARGMVFGRGSKLNIKDHPEVAVKTGTTNDLRDNWTIGFTQDFVVSVWVGNNNNTRMTGVVSGTTGATPIWHRVMTEILKDVVVKKPVRPAEIISTTICNLTGALPPPEGCDSRYEYFNKKFPPGSAKALTANVLVDKDGGYIVGEDSPNAEWRANTVIEDAAGVLVCLSCPVQLTEDGKTPPKIVK